MNVLILRMTHDYKNHRKDGFGLKRELFFRDNCTGMYIIHEGGAKNGGKRPGYPRRVQVSEGSGIDPGFGTDYTASAQRTDGRTDSVYVKILR